MSGKPLCLVTGACGFMGTHMVELLAQSGYPVRATDLEASCQQDDRKRGCFPSVVRATGAELIPADLTDPGSLEKVCQGVEIVFHIAGLFKYSASWEALRAVNEQGTRNLLSALEARGRPRSFIMWGAGGVYGLPNADMLPLTEDTPVNPPNNYLRSKALAEQLVMEWCGKRGLAHAVLRPTTVYGPRAVYGGGQLVMGMARMNPLMAPANFTGRVPFVHVRDVVGAALHLAEKGQGVSGPYNVNDDSQMTQLDLMRFFAQLTGHVFIKLPPIPIGAIRNGLSLVAGKVEHLARDVLHVASPIEADTVQYLNRDFVYSNEKLKSTGYKFVYPDPRPGLAETLQWYRQEGWI